MGIRKLGGRNGKLKCSCGKLRYERMVFCPQCYYSKIRYYVYNGIVTYEGGYDGLLIEYRKEILLLKGFSIDEALSSINIASIYGNHNQYYNNRYILTHDKNNYMTYIPEIARCINGTIKEFKNKSEAEQYTRTENTKAEPAID